MMVMRSTLPKLMSKGMMKSKARKPLDGNKALTRKQKVTLGGIFSGRGKLGIG